MPYQPLPPHTDNNEGRERAYSLFIPPELSRIKQLSRNLAHYRPTLNGYISRPSPEVSFQNKSRRGIGGRVVESGNQVWTEREFLFDTEYFVPMCVLTDECLVDGDELIADAKEELAIWVGDHWYSMISHQLYRIPESIHETVRRRQDDTYPYDP